MSIAGTVALLLAADLYLHHRAERSAGLNRWGYRGPVAAAKQPGETRIAMLGGSTVFGYGVFWDQTIPARLEQALRELEPSRLISVVNLGFNNEGVHALEPTLSDFAYLQADIAMFYPGYNDFGGDVTPNTAVYRRDSPVFRMFGYFPIMPLVLKEKAIVLRTGGQLVAAENAAAMGAPKPVFSPSFADRSSARAMEAAVAVSNALSAQLERLSRQAPPPARPSEAGCASPWVTFCDALYRAIRHGRSSGLKIVVALPPLMTGEHRARHVDQQRAMRDMLARKFAADSLVRVVDLSEAIDLGDRHYSFDGMHLDQDGNGLIARVLAPHLRALIGA
ncbi:MAG TPA: GDSL-type esterase/lipase family protein [Vicinamibacterales bacterium]|nr:GDSL-type esterase/lipase family protein [Vicinamibacterales bacterium]